MKIHNGHQNGDYKHELKRCSCVSYDDDDPFALSYCSNGLFDRNLNKNEENEKVVSSYHPLECL